MRYQIFQLIVLSYQINHFQTLIIIGAGKRLSLNEFREVFLRDTLPKIAKLTNVVF